MLIDGYASLAHYRAHLAPVWAELEERGLTGAWYGRLPDPPLRSRTSDGPILVAGFADYLRTTGPVVFVEHGAGQSYDGDSSVVGNGCYSGGDDLDRVVLFVCPNEQVAARWRGRYPSTPAVAVGCPKLDRWHGRLSSTRCPESSRVLVPVERDGLRGPARVVAVTFHWQCPLVPETLSAWPYYNRQLTALRDWCADEGVILLGHGHPRLWGAIERRWRSLGVERVRDFDEVLDRATLLVGDNTSALPEFASTGRPVLWLNAPWYRRDVHHGGRFWQWPAGQVTVDEPGQLIDGVQAALGDSTHARQSREAMVRSIYAHVDGLAARRAADAIQEVFDAQPVR